MCIRDRPCSWYRYRIEERTSGGRWWPVESGDSDNLFALDDGTARCVIDPERADFVKTRRDVWYGSASGARIHALWGIGAACRFTEQRILPGEELHVIGLFRTAVSYTHLDVYKRQTLPTASGLRKPSSTARNNTGR